MRLIYWFVWWFVVWGVFNIFRAKKEKFTLSRNGRVVQIFAFSSVAFIAAVLFGFPVKKLVVLSTLAILMAPFVVLFGSSLNPLRKSTPISNGFYIHLPFNILFQQVMIYIAFAQILTVSGFGHLVLSGVLFSAAHFPVIFLKWVRQRYLYLLVTFVGGVVFAFLISTFQYGYLFSYLLHLSAYFGLVFLVKNEGEI